MSIPLVQEATKDAINTSIIAIKRNIERINMLLGLVDSGSPDLSGLATKQELEDAITQVETDLAPVDEVTSGNMQSVTSNSVAEMFLNPISNNFAISFSNQTATVTGFLYCTVWKRNSASVIVQEDNTELLRLDMHTSDSSLNPFTILIRKGHQYKIDNRGDTSATIYSQKFVKLF